MTQRVVITAGAGGIGWAIAQAFLAEQPQVHISDVNEPEPEPELQHLGERRGIRK